MASAGKKSWTIAFQIGAKLESRFPVAFKSAKKHIDALQKASSNVSKSWQNFGKQAGVLRRSLLRITGAAAGVGVALLGIANAVANQGDAAAKTAAKLGMTAQGLQTYQYAAEQAGVSSDSFSKNMQYMHNKVAQASKDSKTMTAFYEKTGLDARKLAAMQPELALERIADYLNSIQDPAAKARASLELFGKSGGAEMQAMLAQGSEGLHKMRAEALETGWALSDEEARQAEDFVSAKTKMQRTFMGIRNTIGAKLMPVFTEMFEKISAVIRANMPAIKAFADRLANGIREAIPHIVQFAKRIQNVILWVKDFVGGWGKLAKIAGIIYGLSIAIKVLRVVMAGVNLVFNLGVYAIKAFTVATKVAGIAMKVFNAAMRANPIGLIITAVMLLVGGFIYLYKHCEWFRKIVDKVVAAVVRVFKNAIAWIKANWRKVFDFFIKINPIAIIVRAIIWLVNNWRTAMDKIRNFFGAAVEWIKGRWNVMVEFFSGLWANIIGGIVGFIEKAVAFFTGLPGRIKTLISKIPSIFTDIWEKVKAIIRKFVDDALGFIKPLTDFFKDPLGAIGNKIKNVFGGGQVEVAVSGLPGHATGGIFNKPHIASFAEKGPEAAIPIENTARAYNLWQKTGQLAGFDGGNDRVSVARVGAGGNTTSISLSMPINISGNASQETVAALDNSRNNIMGDVKKMLESLLNEREQRGRRLNFA